MWNSENWIEVNFLKARNQGEPPFTVLEQAVYPAAIAIRVSAIFILIAPFLLTSSARFQRSSDVSLSRNLLQKAFPVFGSIARANRRGTDECDLRAVGLNPAILLFRVAAYLRSHPDRLSFTFLFSLCLWISASDCRRRRRQGPSDDKPSHRRRAYRLELSVLWKKRRTVTLRFWEWG